MAKGFTPQEQKAWANFMHKNEKMKNFVAHQAAFENPYQRIASQPICPRCERPGFHHHGGMICTSCSYTGPTVMKTRQYLKEGWWK
ncbi:hypothetical protein ACFQ3J_00360 [Paenibacillus provencensis]|uniref:Uncharacterized protein n=1 Tax=Paenibacillus provencensis TaxID=441151 RepID=A0ABW3PNT9_9BACL|nr:hypothetical protein [Paenibacillus sp. MER 78]MCM3130954.1 hypothetical protein [Paenibacillus sp. MER 78]